jgi:hypothetical protein
MSTGQNLVHVQHVDRDELAAQIEAERAARGEDTPIASRIEDERDLESLRKELRQAQSEYDAAKLDYRSLRDVFAGR